MKWLYHDQETIVSLLSVEETSALIESHISSLESLKDEVQISETFNGTLSQNQFRLSRKVGYPDNFLPLIKGRIESAPRGCILFIEYILFFSTRLFIIFWTGLTLLFLVYFLILQQWQLAGICLLLCVLHYVITLFFFHRQVKKSKKLLHEVFES